MLYDLINSLNLTISLRMIKKREVFLNAEFVAKFLKFLAAKLGAVIPLLVYQVLDLLTGDSGKQFAFCPLHEVIDNDHNVLEGRRCCG